MSLRAAPRSGFRRFRRRRLERLQHDADRRGSTGGCLRLGIGAIDVDTTPLVAYVGNPTAGWVQQSLPGALAQVLGPGAPGGPPHVRIDTLYLGNGGPGDPDLMRGVATLGGQTIKVRANLDLLSSPTDQALPEQALQGRVQALSVAFAYRLKSEADEGLFGSRLSGVDVSRSFLTCACACRPLACRPI